jgi:hypothetical protein
MLTERKKKKESTEGIETKWLLSNKKIRIRIYGTGLVQYSLFSLSHFMQWYGIAILSGTWLTSLSE